MDSYDASDIALRMSSVLYDSMWSMLSSPNNVTRKLDKVQRQVGGSVVSSMTATPESFKDVSTRLEMLETLLKNAGTTISDTEFENITVTCLKATDLYPSFKDAFTIAKHLHPEIDATPTEIFKSMFLAACEFLTGSREGLSLLKHVCTPTSTQQPQFKICRNRFSTLMADKTAYVETGLASLVNEKGEEEDEEEDGDDDEEDLSDTVSMVSSRHTSVSKRRPPSSSALPMPDVLLEEEEDEEDTGAEA